MQVRRILSEGVVGCRVDELDELLAGPDLVWVDVDHVFVVLHAPEHGEQGQVHYVELDQFIGQGYLVTVHGPLSPAVRPEVAMLETNAVLRAPARR
jgi:hypothetical protein